MKLVFCRRGAASAWGALTAAVLAFGVAGCSDSADDPGPDPPPPGSFDRDAGSSTRDDDPDGSSTGDEKPDGSDTR